jgi:hypothetical protein
MSPAAGQARRRSALTPERTQEIMKTMDRRMYRPAPRPVMLVFLTCVAQRYGWPSRSFSRTEAPMPRDSAARDGGSLQGAASHNGRCDVTAGEVAIGKPLGSTDSSPLPSQTMQDQSGTTVVGIGFTSRQPLCVNTRLFSGGLFHPLISRAAGPA